MAVGNQANNAAINSMLTQDALQLRNVCDQIRNHQTYIGTLGLAGLEAAGFSAADAQTVLTMMGYMNSISAVYYGTGTQASASDFDQALSELWGGQ